jgi:hypothetical protein
MCQPTSKKNPPPPSKTKTKTKNKKQKQKTKNKKQNENENGTACFLFSATRTGHFGRSDQVETRRAQDLGGLQFLPVYVFFFFFWVPLVPRWGESEMGKRPVSLTLARFIDCLFSA